MSALWAPLSGLDDLREPGRSTSRSRPSGERRLRAVPDAPGKLARIPFIGVLIVIFVLGMAGLLMVNTTLQNQAFESRTLNRQASQLAYTQGELEGAIDRAGAPHLLARRASALGMRPNPYPAFLVVPSGKVIGRQSRVTGSEAPRLVVKTPAEREAARTAAEARRKARAAQKAAEAKAKAAAEARKLAAAKKRAEAKAAAKKQAEAKKKAAETKRRQANR